MFIHGLRAQEAICQVLGLDPQTVKRIEINLAPDDATITVITRYMSEKEVEAPAEVIRSAAPTITVEVNSHDCPVNRSHWNTIHQGEKDGATDRGTPGEGAVT